jgi:hypothetical protein
VAARGGPAASARVFGRDSRQCHLKSTGGVLTHFAPTNLYRMREKCEKAAKQDSFKPPGALFD